MLGKGNPVIARHWRKLSVLVSGWRGSRAKLECENGACRWQLQAVIQCFSPILRYLIYICWRVFFQKLGNVLFQVGKVQTNRWLMVKLASPAVGEETEHIKYQFWMQICGAQSCAKLLFKLDCLHVNKALTVWASAGMEFLRMELAAGQRDGAVPVNSSCPHRAQSSSWWVSGLKGLWAPPWHSLWLGTAGLGLVWIKAPTLNIGPVSSCRERLLQCWDAELQIKVQEDKRNRNRCISSSFKALTKHCWIYPCWQSWFIFIIIELVHLSAVLRRSSVGRSRVVLARQAKIQNTSRSECKTKNF